MDIKSNMYSVNGIQNASANWMHQESLENSLNWVPKVQGMSRISQAKGQSAVKFFCTQQ